MPGIVLNQVEWKNLSTEKEYLFKSIDTGWKVGIVGIIIGHGTYHLISDNETYEEEEIENGKIYELPE